MEDEEKKTVVCQYCGEQFSPIRISRKFCTDKCKQAAYRTRLEEKESCKLYTIGGSAAKNPKIWVKLEFHSIKHGKAEFSQITSRFRQLFRITCL